MANYSPPNENLPIFNNVDFTSSGETLTIDYANKHYLKFPTAQGKESLLDVDVAGTANLLGAVNIEGDSCTISTTEIPTITTDYSSITSSDSSTKVPTTEWVQSAVSAGGGNPRVSAYFSNFLTTMNAPIQFAFPKGKLDDVNAYFTVRVSIEILYDYDPSTSNPAGATTTFDGYIDFYPYRCYTSIYGAESIVMNINNSINGNYTFGLVDSVYAPFGRPYWSHSYAYTGNSNGIYFLPYNTPSTNITGIEFYIFNPDSTVPADQRFSVAMSCEVINTGMVNSEIQVANVSTPTRVKTTGFPIAEYV